MTPIPIQALTPIPGYPLETARNHKIGFYAFIKKLA